jgi:hypothetical protein
MEELRLAPYIHILCITYRWMVSFTLITSLLGKEPWVTHGCKAGWDPKPVWIWWHWSLVTQPIAGYYTDWPCYIVFLHTELCEKFDELCVSLHGRGRPRLNSTYCYRNIPIMGQSVSEPFWWTSVCCTFTGNELIRERLQLICLEEKVSCSEDAMKCLVETSGGDLRRAITCLQSCNHLKGSGSEICADDVQEVAGVSGSVSITF